MPVQFTLPPDTRAVGTPNPAVDMNGVVDTLAAFGAAYHVLNAAYSGGADPTGAADSTAAIQSAADAAAAAGGGIVLLPRGTFLTGPLTLDTGCGIQGACPQGTILKLKASAGATANLIMNRQNYSGVNDAQAVTIRNLTLDGNKANNAGNWNCGIVLNNDIPSGSFVYTDGRHQVSNVIIQNFTGDGLVQAGRGDLQAVNVQCWINDGFGFNLNQDGYYANCDAGTSGLDGFLIQGGSNRLVSCKSWFSGAKLVSGRGTGVTLLSVSAPANAWDGGGIASETFSLANGYGNGYLWRNISGASEAANNSGGSYSALGAQDNARAGFFVTGSKQSLTAIEADSNNNCGTNGGVPNGTYAGVDVNASNCVITGTSWDRAANTNHQGGALNITSGSNRDHIQLGFTGTLNDGSNMPPLVAGSVVAQSEIRMAGMGGFKAQTFFATITPDPFAGEIYSVTLTGNVTFNNPALTGTNTTGIFLVPGMRLTLAVTQDATGGRTVTLGGAYRLNGKAFSLVANATTVITFIWDGTSWQAVG